MDRSLVLFQGNKESGPLAVSDVWDESAHVVFRCLPHQGCSVSLVGQALLGPEAFRAVLTRWLRCPIVSETFPWASQRLLSSLG